MNKLHLNGWQDVHEEVLRRIRTRIWAQGDLIPNETELAQEFGCARSTVNRALRAAAESGLLERKRKAGTRVASQPVHRAELKIPVLRKEIEDQNKAFSYALISGKRQKPPASIRAEMKLSSSTRALHLEAIYLADGSSYVYEDRWINVDEIPECMKVDFETFNPNEWLLSNAPFTSGDMSFSATLANEHQATQLETTSGSPLFTVRRKTWNGDSCITLVQLCYAPGHSVHFSI